MTPEQFTDLWNKILKLELRVAELEKRQPKKAFIPPTTEQVHDFMVSKRLDDFTAHAQAQLFVDYWETVDWKRGKTKISNWKAAVNTWLTNFKANGGKTYKQGTGESGNVGRNSQARLDALKGW
jgi:hypothetical protein